MSTFRPLGICVSVRYHMEHVCTHIDTHTSTHGKVRLTVRAPAVPLRLDDLCVSIAPYWIPGVRVADYIDDHMDSSDARSGVVLCIVFLLCFYSKIPPPSMTYQCEQAGVAPGRKGVLRMLNGVWCSNAVVLVSLRFVCQWWPLWGAIYFSHARWREGRRMCVFGHHWLHKQ